MIRFRNGHQSRFFTAAGALGFDGLGAGLPLLSRWRRQWANYCERLLPHRFTIVTKTLTNAPRAGNYSGWMPWRTIRVLPGKSMVNCIGLTNPGLDVWLDKHLPTARGTGATYFVSIAPESVDQAGVMASRIARRCGSVVAGIELNLSCPNITKVPLADQNGFIVHEQGTAGRQKAKLDLAERIVAAVRREAPDCAVTVKAGCGEDTVALARRLDGLADALVIGNSLPWSDARAIGSVAGDSPLSSPDGSSGSVSGCALAATAKRNLQVHMDGVRGTDQELLPVIACGGIMDVQSARDRFLMGAGAIAMWTAFEIDPGLPADIAGKLNSDPDFDTRRIPDVARTV